MFAYSLLHFYLPVVLPTISRLTSGLSECILEARSNNSVQSKRPVPEALTLDLVTSDLACFSLERERGRVEPSGQDPHTCRGRSECISPARCRLRLYLSLESQLQ